MGVVNPSMVRPHDQGNGSNGAMRGPNGARSNVTHVNSQLSCSTVKGLPNRRLLHASSTGSLVVLSSPRSRAWGFEVADKRRLQGRDEGGRRGTDRADPGERELRDMLRH